MKSLNFFFFLSYRHTLLTHCLIKQIHIRLLTVLGFANNTIRSCFFFFFLIIDLHFLIHVVIAQIFNFVAEL